MITKKFKFWFYNRTSQDRHTMDNSVVEKTWTMKSEQELHSYARYEATRIGAYRHEEVYNEE